MGQIRPLFRLFSSFSHTNINSTIQIEKSIDGELGIQTWGRRMVGANETTELGMAGPQFWSDNFFFNIEIEKYVPTYCVTFS